MHAPTFAGSSKKLVPLLCHHSMATNTVKLVCEV